MSGNEVYHGDQFGGWETAGEHSKHRTDQLKFTFIYPNQPGFCDPDLAASVAEAAEQAGFETLLVWDHYSVPWGADTVDAWAFLAYAAARTSRIKLGTCVTPIPFRGH